MQQITSSAAPAAIGPYSQAYRVGQCVYVSGQLPVDPQTGELPEGIVAQAEQSCQNVEAILQAAGVALTRVFKATCFLADMADFSAFNTVYGRYFTAKPVRSCIAVKTLPKNALCEIEVVAEA